MRKIMSMKNKFVFLKGEREYTCSYDELQKELYFPFDIKAMNPIRLRMPMAVYMPSGEFVDENCPNKEKDAPVSKIVNRVCSHILLANLYSKATELSNIGGYGIDQDGSVYIDYLDDPYALHNLTGERGQIMLSFNSENLDQKKHIIVKIGADKKMKAAVFMGTKAEPKPYKVYTGGIQERNQHSGEAAIMAIITACLYKDTEYKPKATALLESFNKVAEAIYIDYGTRYDALDYQDWDVLYQHYLDFECSLLYELEKSNKVVNITSTDIPLLDKEELTVDFAEFFGNSAFFNNKSIQIQSPEQLLDKLSEKDFYLDPERKLTDKEKEYQKNIEGMEADQDMLETALALKLSNQPKNILWTGAAGTGKTTAAQIMARTLNLPYRFINFNPSTEVNDLYMNVLPRSGATINEKEELNSLLSLLQEDPSLAYLQVTGEFNPDVEFTKAASAIAEWYANVSNNEGFIYVESPLVTTFRYGGVCELQEVNTCTKPGVLSGINSAMDGLGMIQLPTGEIVKRHKDAVIIMTMNEGYEGTRKLNQAVKSRMMYYDNFQLPNDDVLVKQIMQSSGYNDSKTVRTMVNMMHEINSILLDNGETDGICTRRQIMSWAAMTKAIGNPYRAFKKTVLRFASCEPEILDSIDAVARHNFPSVEISRVIRDAGK